VPRLRAGNRGLTAFRPALGPTLPPIQWEPGAVFLVVKWPVREADQSPPSSVLRSRMSGAIPHSPSTPSKRGAHFNTQGIFTLNGHMFMTW